MKILKKELLTNKFSHIYIEKAALNNKNTQKILSKFPNSKVIEISNYKEVFSSNNQNFTTQKLSPKLILAVKNENNIYKGAKVCESFNNENFFYTSSIINCLYDCEYCYLQGVYSSANIVIFVNIEDVFEEVKKLLNDLASIYLCISYDTDLLALDNICNFVDSWYELASQYKNLKIELRTKSTNIKNILEKKALDNFIIAFTVSPDFVVKNYEKYTAGFEKRIEAIKRLQAKGWNIRLCIDPIIYVENFEIIYSDMIEKIFNKLNKDKIIDITVGFFRISKDYLKKMRKQNSSSQLLHYPYVCEDGVYSYPIEKREKALNYIKTILLKFVNIKKIYI